MESQNAPSSIATANILGQYQAEADGRMLQRAFVETPEYKTLLAAQYCFIAVGRRGAGKSACFAKLHEHIRQHRNTLTIVITPDELDVIGLKELVQTFGDDYSRIRAASRLAWHAAILCEILARLRDHYRFKSTTLPPDLLTLDKHWRDLSSHATAGRLYQLLRSTIRQLRSAGTLDLTALSHALNTKLLRKVVTDALSQARLRAVVLLDRLDEGWVPDSVSSAFIAGLLTTASEFNSENTLICIIAFVRDNIHRAIERLDTDYTRNIEGITIRLHWDEPSLFNFTCARIRVAFNMSIESNPKVWNRVVARDLNNRDGFRRCLRLTLYRPRDLIALLNQAFLHAAHDRRTQIIGEDVEASAKRISRNRLEDLVKEYDTVFPGLNTIVDTFRNTSSNQSLAQVRKLVSAAIDDARQDPGSLQHLRILGPEGVIRSLYSVGFLGVLDSTSRQFQFSHDGRSPALEVTNSDSRMLVHPCYHLELNCRESEERTATSDAIFDEHDISVVSEQVELRKREVGSLIAQLGNIPKGSDGFALFEGWSKRALQVLCAGHLNDFERHPNSDGINRRDIVAECTTKDGFWGRMLETYRTRQVVFELKNYDEIKKDDCLQLCNYLDHHYGKAGFILTRSDEENLTSTEADWVRDFFYREKGLCIILSAKIIRRLLSKVREATRHDEVDRQLNKLLNRYERNYLENRHIR